MTDLIKKINLEKLGIFSFLIFFLFTPLLVKVGVANGVYVEPLLPFLAASVVLIILSFYQAGSVRLIPFKVKDLFFPNNLAALYFIFIAFLFMTFAYGYVATEFFSTSDLLRLVKYALYFLPFPLAIYAGRHLERKDVNGILAIFVAVGIATAVVSFIRIYSYLNSGGTVDFWTYNVYNRSIGFLGQYLDPFWMTLSSTGRSAGATYGIYASVVLGVFLGLVSRVKKFTRSRFFWSTLVMIVVFGAVLYTLSRGAVLVATLVIAGWLVWSWKSRRIRLAILSLLLVTLANIFLIGENPQVYRKFASTISFRSAETSDSIAGSSRGIVIDSSTAGRIMRWEKIFEMFKEEPVLAIFGVGYNSRNLSFFTNTQVFSTHSFFLDMWARGGLTALFLAIAVWFLLFKTVFRLVFSKDIEVRMLGFPLLGFALGWFIDNLVSGEQFFSDAPMIAFWGVLGLVYSMAEVAKRERRSKKVLIALTSSGPGGAPKVVYDFLSHLKTKGLSFVIAAPAGGVFNSKFRKLGYKVYPASLDRIGVGGFTRLFKIARKEEVDLINSHGKGAGLYARKVGFVLDVPVVQTFHGLHYGYQNRFVRFLYLSLERILANFTMLFVNVSAGQQREGLGLKLFPHSKSRLVVNGVDTTEIDKVSVSSDVFRVKLGLGPKDFVVTMAARFDPVKGHERLVEAIPDLLQKIPNLKIVFAGGGEKRFYLQKLSREHGVHNAVRFLGERSDVLKIFKVSDVAVLPSYHEGMPLTVLEAMACRLPVVGSNVVGIRDLVKDGENGYLIDWEHGSGPLVRALSKLANSSSLRHRMGERGREMVKEDFAMDKFVDRTLKVYEEALAPRQ